MFKMKHTINIFLIATVTGCTGSRPIEENQRTNSEYLVSCPPHIFYCYRKSDLICYRRYRVMTVSSSKENPQMIIKCN